MSSISQQPSLKEDRFDIVVTTTDSDGKSDSDNYGEEDSDDYQGWTFDEIEAQIEELVSDLDQAYGALVHESYVRRVPGQELPEENVIYRLPEGQILPETFPLSRGAYPPGITITVAARKR